MSSVLCCKSRSSKSKYSNEAGYEVYTISEDMLRMKQKMKDRKEGVQVEYVTSRLIVLSCTAETSEKKFVETLLTASQQVQKAHNTHYKVWNVSQRRHDVSSSLDALPFGWPAETAPPLEKLCTICKNIDQWMLEHPLNVAVLFCKGGLERVAIVVNSLMRYNAISAADDSIEDRFNMQRFSERYLGPDGSPSYKRYIGYFTSLLSGQISVNSEPMYLHYVNLRYFEPISVFLKIYERLLPSHQTKTVTLKETTKFEIENGVKLRGDVFIKCIIAASSPGSSSRCLFTCQLNTCSIELPPPTSANDKYSVLKFHKEELDLIFNDKKIDNRVTVELYLSHTKTPSTIASAAAQTVISLLPRNNSYETFEVAQDEHNNRSKIEAEYSEIKKKGKKKEVIEIENEQDMSIPPPVPPKPSTPLLNGDREYGSEVPERRGILPAQVREKINQKKELEGRMTPSIEPDLVGKDRYDKASRCFSYVPAKSMQEAFERPRRTSFSRAIEKRENSVENVSQDEVARASIPRSYTPSHAETQKWDEQVEDAKQAALLEELARAPSAIGQPYPSYQQNNDFEAPLVVDQAQRAVVTPTSTLQRRRESRERPSRYGSYRTLNDENYCSDMDDLCDPDYYMNFTNNAPPVPPPRSSHAGARSVQLPRKKMNPVDSAFNDLDDVLESTKQLSSAYSVGDVRSNGYQNDRNVPNSRNEDQNQDFRQTYRNRNCHSVNAQKENREDDVADNWLSGKLKKVRSKRDIDPDLVRRRTQEKMLLEELKDSSRNEDQQPNGNYRGPGGGGIQNIDPLAEFRREEERLKNTRSPYEPKAWYGRMRGKPPTPPPREASASPVNHRMTPSYEQTRNRHNQSVPLPMHRQYEEDFDVNSILNYHDNSTTLDRGRSLSRGAQIQDAYYASNHDIPSKFYSGQERVAAAIYRAETPHREVFSNGTMNRAETPSRYFPENSVVMERAPTPSFPVSRSTPLPFHPLLFNNNNGQGGYNNGSNTLNNRSASPRHFGGSSTLSRRSSTNSVGLYSGFDPPKMSSSYSNDEQNVEPSSSTTVVIHLHNNRAATNSTSATTVTTKNFPKYGDVSLASSEESSDLSEAEEKDLVDATSSSKETVDSPEEQFDDVVMEDDDEYDGNGKLFEYAKVPRQQLIIEKRIGGNGTGGGGGIGGGTIGILKKTQKNDTSEIIHHHPLFVKDTSKYWYKPTITREQAISMLRDKQPGTFVVRDSNSFPGAFGLALKVATPPPGVNPGDGTELVRHFLIEPSPKGVKLKGCNNEPVFGSLSALVYQHSITALALPSKLVLPDFDPASTPEHVSATQALLEQGAACNVVYVGSVDVESLTGTECVKRSIATCSQRVFNQENRAVSVHFKVSSQGVTLTDNTRKVFFRRHFNVQNVIFAGMDPIDRKFENTHSLGFHEGCIPQARMFAFVARIPSSSENACHVFAELEPEQPASAVVNFINKVMLAQKNR